MTWDREGQVQNMEVNSDNEYELKPQCLHCSDSLGGLVNRALMYQIITCWISMCECLFRKSTSAC